MIGGILVASAYNVSGLCLVMEDLDSTKFQEIYPALGFPNIKPDTDKYEIIMNVVDQCFSPTNTDESGNLGNLMDIIFVREDGEKVTMREKLVDKVVNKIDAKFAGLTLLENSATLADQTSVTDTISILETHPVSAFILPVATMSESADFQALNYDDRGLNGVQSIFGASLNCQDITPSAGSPVSGLGTRVGIQSVATKLLKYGVTTPVVGSCVPDFTCNSEC